MNAEATISAATWWRRFNEALGAGLSEQDAQEFASGDTDIGILRTLVDANVPAELIARIVV